jgi:hypothetical protein
MADITQNIKLTGFLKSDTATITVTLDGAQVFSGAVLNPGSEYVEGTLANFSHSQADTITAITNHTLSITVDSGLIQCGPIETNAGFTSIYTDWQDMCAQIDGATDADWYWRSGANAAYGSATERTNILINGSAPAYPTVAPFPTGSVDDPTWSGWCFEVAAGEVFTCTLRIIPTIGVVATPIA